LLRGEIKVLTLKKNSQGSREFWKNIEAFVVRPASMAVGNQRAKVSSHAIIKWRRACSRRRSAALPAINTEQQ